ncbi:peptidase S41 family protein [Colletotrichum limetticola]|uniref:Peptidase S41 family protein n=1 Tax=Colletotrichum limetticola TaxID=1209924 RepID=A0ABQ9QB93_9PEZI|nr:peptidase S41 family protein [Colletotrichum limetticola]
MRSSFTWALALAGAASAKPTQTTSQATHTGHHATSTPANACAVAQAAAESFLSSRPSATAAAIKPSIAYECLKSIPVDKQNDLDLLNYIEPYINFQSTLEPLANPPQGYLVPGVDVIGGLGQIRARVMKDKYKSQIEFALDIKRLVEFTQASDGHFNYNPALLNLFTFRSLNNLVSVSDDGLSVPRVYLISDFLKSYVNDTDVYDIKSIDDVPITEWLEAQSARVLTQDPDAKYNSLFNTNPATEFQGVGNEFVLRFPGHCPDKQVIKFTNGTEYVDQLVAIVGESLVEYLSSAEAIHSKVELPPTSTSSVASSSSATSSSTSSATPTTTQIPGYPLPVSKHASDWISTYFLNGSYGDTAVLAVSSFAPSDIDTANSTFEIAEARRVVDVFLKKAKEAGKKKLVIDLQANGGGFIAAGFQLYNQLFPKTTDIWDGNRIRAHEAFDAIGLTAQEASPDTLADLVSNVLNDKLEPFNTWEDLYGPEVIAGQNVTNLLRYNQTRIGYPKSTGDQVFLPENIVIITDGICASTCTIFTGLLVREQGVRTIALGGRPSEAPMQAIGGVEGSEVLDWPSLQAAIMQVASDAIAANETDILEAAFDVLPDLGDPPLLPTLAKSGGSFNYRNAYARKRPDGFPEQFIYEAANCRLFYTSDMLTNITEIWTRSADSAWNKAKCVAGSTISDDGIISNDILPYSDKVIGMNLEYKGPGSLSYKGPYEPPSPYVQKHTNSKRSIVEQLNVPENFVYEPTKHKIGDLKEYLAQNMPEDFKYEQKDKIAISHTHLDRA